MIYKNKVEIKAGLIDSDFKDEIIGLFFNFGKTTYRIKQGQRLCQLIVHPVVKRVKLLPVGKKFDVNLINVQIKRVGGIGSTGI